MLAISISTASCQVNQNQPSQKQMIQVLKQDDSLVKQGWLLIQLNSQQLNFSESGAVFSSIEFHWQLAVNSLSRAFKVSE